MSVAQADSHATIEAMHPSADATLGRNGTFHVLIAYRSDEPISLWARPFRNGREVTQAMSNASARHEGTGQALGWFALTEPGSVDEIRIRAGGGDPYREWELARAAVALQWTGADVPDEARPRWVNELQAAEDARMRAEAQRRANEPVSGGDVAFMSGFMLFMFALGDRRGRRANVERMEVAGWLANRGARARGRCRFRRGAHRVRYDH